MTMATMSAMPDHTAALNKPLSNVLLVLDILIASRIA
jgi:hypothetical protein